MTATLYEAFTIIENIENQKNKENKGNKEKQNEGEEHKGNIENQKKQVLNMNINMYRDKIQSLYQKLNDQSFTGDET